MDKETTLKAELREHTGSKAARKVRLSGRIPAIVYGHKKEPIAITLDAHNFVEDLHHAGRLMDVQIKGKKEKVLVRDVQYDHLGKNIIHADLIRVDVTEKIVVEVPIELKGSAKSVEGGGIINEHTGKLAIECLATEIPENIVVSVKDIHIGDSIRAGDIVLAEGLKLMSDPETLIVTCSIVSKVPTTEELEEEGPAAPEVIGEVKEESTEEQEGKG